jgi:hypothetical protein
MHVHEAVDTSAEFGYARYPVSIYSTVGALQAIEQSLVLRFSVVTYTLEYAFCALIFHFSNMIFITNFFEMSMYVLFPMPLYMLKKPL